MQYFLQAINKSVSQLNLFAAIVPAILVLVTISKTRADKERVGVAAERGEAKMQKAMTADVKNVRAKRMIGE